MAGKKLRRKTTRWPGKVDGVARVHAPGRCGTQGPGRKKVGAGVGEAGHLEDQQHMAEAAEQLAQKGLAVLRLNRPQQFGALLVRVRAVCAVCQHARHGGHRRRRAGGGGRGRHACGAMLPVDEGRGCDAAVGTEVSRCTATAGSATVLVRCWVLHPFCDDALQPAWLCRLLLWAAVACRFSGLREAVSTCGDARCDQGVSASARVGHQHGPGETAGARSSLTARERYDSRTLLIASSLTRR